MKLESGKKLLCSNTGEGALSGGKTVWVLNSKWKIAQK